MWSLTATQSKVDASSQSRCSTPTINWHLQENIEQRSLAWAQRRKIFVTASEIGTVAGLNKWKSGQTLLGEKLCSVQPELSSDDVLRGVDFEERALTLFAAEQHVTLHRPGLILHWRAWQAASDAHLTDVTCMHVDETWTEKFDAWLAASPDAITSDGRIVEVKCPREIKSAVPRYHMPQVQMLLEVTGLRVCEYVQYDVKKDEVKTLSVHYNEAEVSLLKRIGFGFWTELMQQRRILATVQFDD